MTEASGRKVTYGYDNLYRLTNETIAGDQNGNSGSIGYSYDAVGNRTQQTSTSPAITSGAFGYDADDRLTGDVYDANGNTINTGGQGITYDFENHILTENGATYQYDGDGNRVRKTVGGITTSYAITSVATSVNPEGLPLVGYEGITGFGGHDSYRYWVLGLRREAQYRQPSSGSVEKSYYVYDGHGSARALTDASGNVTDTYDYDAFGNLIHSATTLTSPTPNEFLFAGEQYDTETGHYYNRARYLNTTTGRFWTMDTAEATPLDPETLHRYLYVHADPVDELDPTGLYTQAYGYEVEGIVRSAYLADFGPDPQLTFGGWARIGDWSRSAPYSLKPDILDKRPSRNIWMEVKPLSLSGIARATASWATYNAVFDPQGIFPDVRWLTDGETFPSSQGKVLVFNEGGILFYTTNQSDYYQLLDAIRVFAAGLASVSLYQLVKTLPTAAPSPAAGSEVSEILSLARTAIEGGEAEFGELGLDVGVAVY